MKNKKLLLLLTFMLPITSCNQQNLKLNDVVFEKQNIVINSFNGLGVEWGVYEDTNKIAKEQWNRIYSAVKRLNPKLVRCMTNFDWIVKNFDSKGNDDINDDTWEYDFTNKYMINCCEILDFCQENDINVAFGVWNVIGNVDETKDEWKMIKNTSADIRWAKLSADLLEYLVKVKGYTCIKYFVNTNEPNYTGAIGASKNAYNTYDTWRQGVLNVRKVFDEIGLNDIDIIGGDTTGFNGCMDYLPKIASNLNDVVNNYGIHMYISNYDIDNGNFMNNLKSMFSEIKKIDNKLGASKDMIIWEAGLLDGKNVQTDCNAYIANYSYGIRMADYTIQSILAGINGVVYWDLDDGMHFMYNESNATPKEWGMFSSLNDSSSLKQEYRSWYHSSTLLTNLLAKDCKIYKATTAYDDTTFRCIASIDKDNKNAGFVAVNRKSEEITKSFVLKETINNTLNKMYVYIFNESSLRLNSDGFVVENYIIDGSLNNITNITIPANSVVVVSTRRL